MATRPRVRERGFFVAGLRTGNPVIGITLPHVGAR